VYCNWRHRLHLVSTDPEESSLDINKILDELRQEHTQLEEAILSMERLAAGQGRRRGRPPAWLAAAQSMEPGEKRRGRPAGSKNRDAEAKLSS
jgi:hypothetical protein